MKRLTPTRIVLFERTIALVCCVLLCVVAVLTATMIDRPHLASAATSGTLNFQARLLQASGALVPDGYYHAEFKLYNDLSPAGTQDQGACTYNTGTPDSECLWFETYTGASTAARVRVVNGYLTVNLGTNTAFPSTVNWDQDLWLSMRIGGSVTSASWDPEMSPRLKLTAVPYAFRAGQLAKQTGANTSTLSFATQTAARTLLLPDASGTLAIAGGGTFTTNGVLYGNGTASIQATAAGTTGQCLLATTGSAPSWGTCATGTVTLQSAYNASSNPEITVDATRGALTIRDASSAIGANLLEVQNNAGTTTYFSVTSAGAQVRGEASAAAAVGPLVVSYSGSDDVGVGLTADATAVTGGGGKSYTFLSTGGGTGPGAGSLVFYNNTDNNYNMAVTPLGHLQLAPNQINEQIAQLFVQPNAGTNYGIRLRAHASASVPVLLIENSSSVALLTVNQEGRLIVQNSTNNTDAVGIYDVAGQSILNVDTINKIVGTRPTTNGSATAAFTLQSGSVAGGSGASGNVSIDSGSTSGTPGTVTVGGTNTRAVNIGNATSTTAVSVLCGTGACGFGNNAIAHATTVGSLTGGAATTLQAGTGGLNITTQGTGALAIGNNAVAQILNIGNVTGATALNLRAGTGNFTLDGVTSTTYDLAASTTTGTIAFGGTAQSGAITLGRSTVTNTINMGSSIGGSNTQTINIGTSATASSTTNVNIGSTIAGTTTINGNSVLGNSTSNTLTVTARINSSLIPNTDDTYDLGSSTLRWRDLYLGGETIHIGTSASDESTLGYDTTANALVINEGALDADVRIEGVSDTNLVRVDASANNVGIGAATPGAKLHVQGTTAANVVNIIQGTSGQTGDLQRILNNSNDILGRVDAGGNMVASIDAPSTAAVACATTCSTGGSPSGIYNYVVTFVTAYGETLVGPVSNDVTVTSKTINLTSVPTGVTGTKSRKIYRTPDLTGMTAGKTNWRYVGTIADNTTTTFNDNIADTALGESPPVPVAAPFSAPWISFNNALTGRTGTLVGNYKYRITYVTPWGETAPSPFSNTVTASNGANGVITLNELAMPANTNYVSAMRVYRTQTGAGANSYYNPTLRAYGSASDITQGGTITDPNLTRRDDANVDGSLKTNIVPPATNNTNRPAAPSATIVASAGNLSTTHNGVQSRYVWAFSYVDSAGGEGPLSPMSSEVTPTGGSQQATIGSVTAGPAGTVARKIYRANLNTQGKAVGFTGYTSGDIVGTFVLVATVGDNSTTTYVDNIADSALLVNRPKLVGPAGAGMSIDHLKVTAPQGSPPLIVNSTTMVKNLNAELLGGNDQLGIKDFTYNIDESLKNFRAALANTDQNAAVVNVIGDSIIDGHYSASSRQTTNIPGRIRTQLQSKYGNGGTGWQKGVFNDNWVKFLPGGDTTQGIDDPSDTDATNPDYEPTLGGANGNGLSLCNKGLSGQASMTLTFWGTKVDIQYATFSAFYQDLGYSIDNGYIAGTISEIQTNFGSGRRLTVADPSNNALPRLDPNASHTIRVWNNGSVNSGLCSIVEGVDATYPTGVRVNNVSIGGAAASNYYNDDDSAAGSFNPKPDLVILDFSTNEFALSFSLSAFKSAYQRWLSQLRRLSDPPDCILMVPPMASSGAAYSHDQFRDVIYQLADENGCGVVDIARKWNNSYTWAQSHGLMASSDAGTSGADGVHPSETGYADIASTILGAIDRGVQMNARLTVDNSLSQNGGLFSLTSLAAPQNLRRTGTSLTTGTLTSGNTFRYVVTAMNDYGESPASAEAQFVVATGTGAIVLQWDPVPGATKYRVYRCWTSGCAAGSAGDFNPNGFTSNVYTDVVGRTGLNDNGSVFTNGFMSADAPTTYISNSLVGASVQGSSETALSIMQQTGDQVVNVDTTYNPYNLINNSGFEDGTNSPNLIRANAGFEETDDDFNYGWNLNNWLGRGLTWNNGRTMTQAYEGNNSMYVNSMDAINEGVTYKLPLTINTSYELSFWAKTESTTTGTWLGAAYSSDSTTGDANTCTLNTTTIDTTWRNYSCVFTTSGTVSANAFFVIKQTSAATRSMYIDNVAVRQVTSTPPIGWAAKGAAGVVAFQTKAQDYAGKASMQINTTAGGSNTDGAKYNVTLVSGTSYTLSFYAKLLSGSMTTLQAGYAANGSTDANCTLNSNAVSISGWARYSCTFTAGAASGTPYVYVKQTDSFARTIYIDSIQMEAGGVSGSGYMSGGLIQLNGTINSSLQLQNSSDSTNAFTVNNAAGTTILNVDTLNGRVGVGTGTPAARLEVKGTSVVDTSASIAQATTNANETLLNIRNDGQVALGTNRSASVVGSTSVALNPEDANNTMRSTKFTVGGSSTSISTISVYIMSPVGASPNNKFTMAIYSDSAGAPNTLVATSAEGTIVPDAWNTVTISATLSASTTYWFAYNSNGAAGQNRIKYNISAFGNSYWRANTYSTTYPGTFGAGTLDSFRYSMFVTASSPTLGTAPLTVNPSGMVNVQGTLQASGPSYFGVMPGSDLYTAATANIVTAGAGVQTQLNIINTYPAGGTGTAVDFYTYTDAGNGTPQARLNTIDDGNYSNDIIFYTKNPGNAGNNALVNRLQIESTGELALVLGTQSPTAGMDLQFGGGANRTIGVLQNTAAGAGRNLTVQGGQANTANNVGGDLILQGGAGAGSGVGGSVAVQPLTNTTTAFEILNAAGSTTVLAVDTTSTVTNSVLTMTNAAVFTTTGRLMTLTANSATTPTGLLTVNATGLTTGYAVDINVDSVSTLTTGGGLRVDGPSGAAALGATNGLLKVSAGGAFTTSAALGGLLQLSGGTVTGTMASITGSAVMTTTGNLLTLAANSATTATGLLTLSGTSLTSGSALNINAGTGNALTINNGSALDLASGTAGNTATIKVPTRASGTCATGVAEGIIFKDTGGTQRGHMCIDSGTPLLKFYANAFSATSTDVAENYSDTTNSLEPGDLVVLSTTGPKSVEKATKGNQSQLFGVISTAPGLLLSGIDDANGATDLTHPKPVALTGRIPTKVSTENGAIGIGDYLTVSTTAGVAMKATGPGMVIGRALESYSSGGVGKIEVLSDTHYYNGQTAADSLQTNNFSDLTASGTINTQNLQVSGTATVKHLTVTDDAVIKDLVVTGSAEIANLTVTNLMTAQKVTVTDTLTTQRLVVHGDAEFEGNIHMKGATNVKQSAITRTFKASGAISVGSVVVLDSTHDGYVTTTVTAQDTRIIGVAISESHQQGDDIIVATGGQVQVSLGATTTIAAGDLLVADTAAGMATAEPNPRPGAVLGKATSRKDIQTNKAWILLILQ